MSSYVRVAEDADGLPDQTQPVFPPIVPQYTGPVVPADPTLEEFEKRINERRVLFSMDSYFRDAWALTKANFCVLLLGMLTWLVILFGVLYGFMVFDHAVLHRYRHHHYDEHNGDTYNGDWYYEEDQNMGSKRFWINFGVMVGMQWIAGVFFLLPALASAYLSIFNAMKTNGIVRFCHFFSGYCRLWECIKFGTLWGLIYLVLSFAFFVPALLFAFFTTFSFCIYLDQRTSFWQSIKFSKRLVAKYPCNIVGFCLASFLVALLGLLCLGVGIFLAAPVIFAAHCFLYHHIAGVNGCPLAPAVNLPVHVPAPASATMYPAYAPQPVMMAPMVAAPLAPAPVAPVSGPYAFYPQPQPLPGTYAVAARPHMQAVHAQAVALEEPAAPANGTYVRVAAPSYDARPFQQV